MNPILRNILLVAVFSFTLSFDCCYFGTMYDTRYELYPEWSGGCLSYEFYGARWQRLGTAIFYLFLGSLLAVFIHLRRNEQAQDFDKLSIFKS
jgi:hypothetical protein